MSKPRYGSGSFYTDLRDLYNDVGPMAYFMPNHDHTKTVDVTAATAKEVDFVVIHTERHKLPRSTR